MPKRVRTVTGCLTCRQRRVKCDETKPKCQGCQRHPDRQCVYPFDEQPEEMPVARISQPLSLELSTVILHKLSDDFASQLRTSGHDEFLNVCLSEMNQESHMVAQATVYALNGRNSNLDDLFSRYQALLKAKTDPLLTGRLSAAGFMLLLAEMTGQRPQDWRRITSVYTNRIMERGGPEQLLEAKSLTVERPRIMSLHLEYAAVIEVFNCLLHRTEPLLLRHSAWFERLPEYGAHDLLGVPRFSISLLARTVTLLAQPEDERVLFERSCLLLELQQAWPSRLQRYAGSDRQRFGGELYRLASLTLLSLDQSSPTSTLLQYAAAMNLSFTGWAWPIAICATTADSTLRSSFTTLLQLAKSPLDGRTLHILPVSLSLIALTRSYKPFGPVATAANRPHCRTPYNSFPI